MNAELFSRSLQLAKPSSETLERIGLNRQEIAEIQTSFDLKERSESKVVDVQDPDLSELISKYDPSNIEIGMVRMLETPENSPLGWRVGQVEADYLVVDKGTGEIVVEEIASPGYVIWRCAADGGRFMSSMATAAKYLAECLLEDKARDAQQAEAFEVCVSLAGGRAYEPFYRMLLGIY